MESNRTIAVSRLWPKTHLPFRTRNYILEKGMSVPIYRSILQLLKMRYSIALRDRLSVARGM